MKANINQNIKPNSIKMTHITSTMQRKTNDTLRKRQSMPNDAALYINGQDIGLQHLPGLFEVFCVRTLVFWLMVLMIAEFACREGSIKKQCGWLAPSKLIGTHHLAIQISTPFDIVGDDFGFDANESCHFLIQKEPRERQRRFKQESLSVPSNCYEKDR